MVLEWHHNSTKKGKAMTVSLKFSFESIDAAQAFLVKCGAVGAVTTPALQPAETVAPQAPAAITAGDTTPAAAPADKKKPGPKPKKTEGGETPPAPAPKLTDADVRKHLMAVAEKFGENGLAKVAEILQPFGVQRITDLKPEQYAEVMKAADAVVA